MAVEAVAGGSPTPTPTPSDDSAASLIAAHRTNGTTDMAGLAADIQTRSGGNVDVAKTLTAQVEAQLSPVERGQFAAAQAPANDNPSQEGVGAFFEGAFKGDYSDNNSWSKTAGQVAMGFVPIAGQAADIRDASHAVGQIWNGEFGGWFNLGTSLIGFVPGVGDAVKGALRGGSNAVEAGADVAKTAVRQGDHVAATAAHQSDEALQAGEKVAVKRFTSADEFNAAANAAAPNTRYEFGNYAYTTDAKGRIGTAEGTIDLAPTGRNDNALQTAIGHEGRPTDVGFHLIADRFGAQTNRLNVVPGNGKPIGDGLPNLNTGAYKRFENTVADIAAQPGNKVEVKIEARYEASNSSSRPDEFVASYRVNDGKWREQTFVNK